MATYKNKAVLQMFREMGAEIKEGKLHLNGRSTIVPDYREIDDSRLTIMRRNLGITGRCVPA